MEVFIMSSKKKYAHLNFSENDIKMIMEDMKENENKLIYLKDKIVTTENKRKFYFKERNEEIKKNWEKSMINMEKFKIKKMKEPWESVIKYKLLCQNNFRKNSKKMEKISNDFDYNLKFLVDETGKNKNKEESSSEIIMIKMRQKLNEKIKNKRDKEKRERKRLKEEQESNYRIFAKKSMDDMVNILENNLKKEKNEPIKINEDLLSNIEIKEKEEKALEKKANGEKVKETNKNEDKDKISSGKSRNKYKSINEDKISEFKIKEELIKNETESDNKIKEAYEKEKMGQTATSSYSKLSTNDYGLGLINECLSIHNFNININDRIQLFKTFILPINKDEIEKQYNNFPKIDINSNSTNQSLIKNYSCSNIYDKSTSFNNSSINKFDKKLYLEEIDKINMEDFNKNFEKKLAIFYKNKNLLQPILKEILDITEYIQSYQERKGIYLIDNSKWDELMIKFKNQENIDDYDEENKNVTKKEDESEYLFDYGDKITNEDDKRIFDYMNYIGFFNDLIIPNEMRGKKFLYPELYKDFYIKQNNNGIDIKEYEPNEIENENLCMPKNANIKDFKLSDIIENIIENKNINNNENIKGGLNNILNAYEKRGKYFFIPIKMSISGYPLSGKKIQSSFINEKYKGIKIYNPQKLLESKMKDYKDYKAYKDQPEKLVSAKGKQKNKKDEHKTEIEDPRCFEGRTYKDYQEFMKHHPDTRVVEMDTVVGCEGSHKVLLTLHFDNCSFMAAFLLLRVGVMEKNEEMIEDALNQWYWHIKYLQNPDTGFYYHGYNNITKDHMSGIYWGRANAWAAFTMSKVGEILPEAYLYPKFLDVAGSLNEQLAALKTVQTENGLWRTVLTDEESYEEISASAGIAAAMLNRGNPLHSKYINKSIKGLLANVSPDGKVMNVSAGTAVMKDIEGYRNISRDWIQGWGQGLMLAFLSKLLVSSKIEKDGAL